MKRTLFFALTAAAVMSTQAQNPDVFFSEYVEGSSNNKSLEIYNGTGASIDLGDYRISSSTNGNGYSSNYNFAAGTTVAAGDVYVISNGSASASILSVTDLVQTSVAGFNGNDARSLEYLPTGDTTWVQLDVIAGPSSSAYPDVAGVSQGTKNHTLRRKTSITTGNTDFSVSAGTDSISSEWEVYDIDVIDDLGNFGINTSTDPEISFNNSADTVTMSAFAADLPITYDFYYTFSNFTVGVDGLVKYAYIDASNTLSSFDTTTTGLFSLNLTDFGTHTVAVGFTDLLGVPTGEQDTIVIVVNESVITDVATIADLRAQTEGEYYRLTGEAVISYLQSFRNQKFIQDATAGILIDDSDNIITGTFNVYDGLTNITGELTSYSGLKQFKPSVDITTASSIGNVITPEVITVADFNANIDDYESELVQIMTATVTGDTTVFENGDNYTITDASGDAVFRTQFYGVDYIGTTIPGASHYTGVAIRYNSTAQLVSRDLMDICEIDYDVADIVIASVNPTTLSTSIVSVEFEGPAGFDLYAWDFGNDSTSSEQNPTFDYTTNSTYTVELTVTNHCGIEKTVTKEVEIDMIGVNEYTAFTMFPVPVKNVLNVDFTSNTEKVISVYNILGVKVEEQLATSQVMINTSEYNSGIYILSVNEGDNTTVKRFVVE